MQIKMKFDPATKVRAYIDDAMADRDYIPSDLAHKLIAKLREEDPQLLAQWLDAQAITIMRDTINRINSGRRSVARQNSNRSVFANAIERAEAGEPALLEGWLSQEFVISPENVRRPLAQMYREEILYASTVYDRLAEGNRMQAVFLRALADRVGARQVGEVFDNDQLSTLWRSIS